MPSNSPKHGHATGGVITPTYYSWAGMVARCTNRKHKAYERYGGRGVAVCNRWLTFANFLADMGEKPRGMSIERKDNSRRYEPGNCVWASPTTQARNKRNNRVMTLNGVSKTLAEWAEQLGIHPATLSDRKQRGWSDEKALTAPIQSAENNSRSQHVTFNGETLTIAEWARRSGVNVYTLYRRFRRGLPPEVALQPRIKSTAKVPRSRQSRA